MGAFDSTTIRITNTFVCGNVNIEIKLATFACFLSISCVLINITTCHVERPSRNLSVLNRKIGDSRLSGTCVLDVDGAG
jgi:hypothetical protein